MPVDFVDAVLKWILITTSFHFSHTEIQNLSELLLAFLWWFLIVTLVYRWFKCISLSENEPIYELESMPQDWNIGVETIENAFEKKKKLNSKAIFIQQNKTRIKIIWKPHLSGLSWCCVLWAESRAIILSTFSMVVACDDGALNRIVLRHERRDFIT